MTKKYLCWRRAEDSDCSIARVGPDVVYSLWHSEVEHGVERVLASVDNLRSYLQLFLAPDDVDAGVRGLHGEVRDAQVVLAAVLLDGDGVGGHLLELSQHRPQLVPPYSRRPERSRALVPQRIVHLHVQAGQLVVDVGAGEVDGVGVLEGGALADGDGLVHLAAVLLGQEEHPLGLVLLGVKDVHQLQFWNINMQSIKMTSVLNMRMLCVRTYLVWSPRCYAVGDCRLEVDARHSGPVSLLALFDVKVNLAAVARSEHYLQRKLRNCLITCHQNSI